LEEQVLEYLGYAVFGVLMIGCLAYVMSALETEEAPSPKPPHTKH